MQIGKIEFGFILVFCFVIGLVIGGIFITTNQEDEEIFPVILFKDKNCEVTLLECYISLQKYLVDYKESKNYVIDSNMFREG